MVYSIKRKNWPPSHSFRTQTVAVERGYGPGMMKKESTSQPIVANTYKADFQSSRRYSRGLPSFETRSLVATVNVARATGFPNRIDPYFRFHRQAVCYIHHLAVSSGVWLVVYQIGRGTL